VNLFKLAEVIASAFASKVLSPAQQDAEIAKDLADAPSQPELPPWEGAWPDARH
jgi:hypothetical protein